MSESGHTYRFGAPSKGWPSFGPDGKIVREVESEGRGQGGEGAVTPPPGEPCPGCRETHDWSETTSGGMRVIVCDRVPPGVGGIFVDDYVMRLFDGPAPAAPSPEWSDIIAAAYRKGALRDRQVDEQLRRTIESIPDHDGFRREPVVAEILNLIAIGQPVHPTRHDQLLARYDEALRRHGLDRA